MGVKWKYFNPPSPNKTKKKHYNIHNRKRKEKNEIINNSPQIKEIPT